MQLIHNVIFLDVLKLLGEHRSYLYISMVGSISLVFHFAKGRRKADRPGFMQKVISILPECEWVVVLSNYTPEVKFSFFSHDPFTYTNGIGHSDKHRMFLCPFLS